MTAVIDDSVHTGRMRAVVQDKKRHSTQ